MTSLLASPDDFGIPHRNAHGYVDPTACKALKQVQRAEFGYRPLIYICSPYAGDIDTNTSIARAFCRRAVDLRSIPIAPRLLFPQFMVEPDERDLAMCMGRVLLSKYEAIWVYTEQVTAGMRQEIEWAKLMDLPTVLFDANLHEVAW
ncbi:MAG: DUF4406 domain-containing protein [Cutibacterium avidum]|nr:DUF4406 domain-containing protein [Cutibacterium avidum]MDU3283384.1 DUF4406 domain-containing protein [Cutibacterium avidum]MDU3749925.1 DUF4406 domain-containing protein [Cutibacterium avidum]